MLKFHKSTMIALYAMIELARDPEAQLAATEIADRFHVSVHHLAKVLQQLVRVGLVKTTRGASGGHTIARDPGDVTLLEIVEVFEGPARDGSHCLLIDPLADHRRGPFCALHPVMVELDEQVTVTLQSISLKTLVKGAPAART
jgi:Rrf2 family protein